MFKMHFLEKKIQKSPSAGGFPPLLAPLNLRSWWLEVAWFVQSFQWRHRIYVTEKRHQTKVTRFFNFGPLPIKISGYVSASDDHTINNLVA